jgi:asparagine synthase (glutamine-hydrolysing)
MADRLGTQHHVVQADYVDIGRVFPDVIWHAETPVLRTAPAPMFLLSKLVRQNNFKVVLTGEGADEFLAGYAIFKEAKVRRFWARQPDSSLRPLLLQRLYPDIPGLTDSGRAYLIPFFSQLLTDVEAGDYSHAIRWRNTARTHRFLADTVREAGRLNGHAVFYPPNFGRWGPLQKAQFLEITTFLSSYLLSSQGDRMGMAHAVEGRFPFLDHRLIEFCNKLPARFKLRGLNEKYLLKQAAQDWLPAEIWRRPKRPYRAPIHRSFFNESTPEYVRELLSPRQIGAFGLFKPAAVDGLVRKIEDGRRLSETDDMALAGILSGQIVYMQFVSDFKLPPPLTTLDDVKVCFGHKMARIQGA